ncbi:MAG TPA: asparagine synthase-related protein [Candidatus Kapabacteria bacterium]|nr:asparagine synthase-related protein [Candidatus Kapabacteria bacterium]
MSGIVALLHTDGRHVPMRELHAMAAAIMHRGRNGCEELAHGTAGLACCLTHAEPEGADTPLPRSPATGRIVAADVRLDRRTELCENLGCRHEMGGLTDGELVLRAYERWGERCVHYLQGDFAFVLWDPERDGFFCARDRVGVKPFYYHHGSGLFAAASEIRALLVHPAVTAQPDDLWIGDYLAGLFTETDATFYSDIRRLMPAHTMRVDASGLQIERYARFDPEREVRCASDADYAEAFAERFTRAVGDRMRSALPVGAALSGGLDSSSVACVARSVRQAEGGEPLATFSAIFTDVPQSDESRYIDAVIRSGGFAPNFVRGDLGDPLAPVLLDALDYPFFAPNLFLHAELFAAAHNAGIGVWLDGLDGDTTVSHGTARLAELAASLRIAELWHESGALADRLGHGSRARTLRRAVINPLLRAPLSRGLARIGRRSPLNDAAIDRAFAAGIRLEERYRAVAELPAPRTLREDHYRRLTWGMHSFVLELLDQLAAHSGIEPRYPFYDWELMNFCLALPPEQKLQDGWGRIVLRRAMQGVLPHEVQWRTGKGNPGANFIRALRMRQGERFDAMVKHPGELGRYMNVPRLGEMLTRFIAGGASDQETMTLWRALTLWIWIGGA